MKFIGKEAFAVAGVQHAPGQIVDLVGKDLQDYFADKVLPIEDARLVRTLEANAHPYTVVEPLRWGRVDYAKGALIWVAQRSQLKSLPAGSVRPATAKEVLAWAKKNDPEPIGELPADAPKRRGRKKGAAA